MQAEFSPDRGNGFVITPPRTIRIPTTKNPTFNDKFSRTKAVFSSASHTFSRYAVFTGKKLLIKAISTVISVCCILSFFNFFSIGTGVYVGASKIAVTSSRTEFLSAVALAKETADNYGIATLPDFTTTPVISFKSDLLTKDKLKNILLVSGGDFIHGYTLYSGDTPIFNAESLPAAQKAIQKYISEFSKGAPATLSSDITYKENIFLKSELSDEGNCIKLLRESNSLNVISVINYHTVEPLPYETLTENDSTLYIGESVTITEGENGTKQISGETTYENGIEKTSRIISESITKAPVNKLIKLGTKYKEVLKSGFKMPLEGILSSPFGSRWGRMHEGIDIAVPEGTPVKAAECGTVSYVSENAGGYGKLVRIDHGYGVETVYAHLSKITVTPGQNIPAGETIALSGNTGRSTGPHLHFEILQNDTPVDPSLYLK